MFKPAVGAGLAILSALLLWGTPLGDGWVNASYDYLFRFTDTTVTNDVVIIQMDNESFDHYQQTRDKPWSRSLHTALLNRLADDGCSLVVVDIRFAKTNESSEDAALAAALSRLPRVALAAIPGESQLQLAEGTTPNAEAVRALVSHELFLDAASNNWGIAWFDPESDSIVRRHWPRVPGPERMPSLPSVAARLAGVTLPPQTSSRWFRYYGPRGAWATLSYRLALTQKTNYFRDKIVFLGNKPQSTVPGDGELDKFSTPYTSSTGEAVGGVEMLATAFLNLLNHDWLRRTPWWAELAFLVFSGALIGTIITCLRPGRACALALGLGLLTMVVGVSLSVATNFWSPWLVVAGGQLPVALAWALFANSSAFIPDTKTVYVPQPAIGLQDPDSDGLVLPRPDAPDYEIVDPPFGKGAFGKVWLARNAIGQWQALKAVYLAHFKSNPRPYEREFSGIERYKPVSDGHPGLLRVDFISKKKADGYFYYVMELGDSFTQDWQNNPSTYKPRDLARVRSQSEGRRIPAAECIRIGISLCEAIHFLHSQSLTHGDIKPQNVIFVNGQPKLADVGLVNELLLPGEERTWMGTPGYMPPPPERPGTPQADIYALGMLLYVIYTGQDPDLFPSVATAVIDKAHPTEFMKLNSVILKACHPDLNNRFRSAQEFAESLRALRPQSRPTEEIASN